MSLCLKTHGDQIPLSNCNSDITSVTKSSKFCPASLVPYMERCNFPHTFASPYRGSSGGSRIHNFKSRDIRQCGCARVMSMKTKM
eukprot:3509740-Amphidinium_carterae.1